MNTNTICGLVYLISREVPELENTQSINYFKSEPGLREIRVQYADNTDDLIIETGLGSEEKEISYYDNCSLLWELISAICANTGLNISAITAEFDDRMDEFIENGK